jgi:hypothetical protein
LDIAVAAAAVVDVTLKVEASKIAKSFEPTLNKSHDLWLTCQF